MEVVIIAKDRFLDGLFRLVLLNRSRRLRSQSRIRRVRFVWIMQMIVDNGMENVMISAQNNAKNSIFPNVMGCRAKRKFASI